MCQTGRATFPDCRDLAYQTSDEEFTENRISLKPWWMFYFLWTSSWRSCQFKLMQDFVRRLQPKEHQYREKAPLERGCFEVFSSMHSQVSKCLKLPYEWTFLLYVCCTHVQPLPVRLLWLLAAVEAGSSTSCGANCFLWLLLLKLCLTCHSMLGHHSQDECIESHDI